MTERTRRPLYALLTANGISGFGNEMAALAIPWFVLQMTGSASDVGLTAFAILFPFVLATFIGGSIVDRLGFRRTSVIGDLASGLTVALIPLLHVTVGVNLPIILILVFLGTLLDAPGITARQSMIPEIAGASALPLERANSIFESVLQFKNLLGPLAAGLLIATSGATIVLTLNALTFGVSALLIRFGVPDVRSASRERTIGFRAGLASVLAGLRFIRSDNVLFSFAIMAMVGNMRLNPLFYVIMPVYASQVFDSAIGLGVTLAAFGGTAFFSAIAYGMFGRRVPRRTWFLVTQTSGLLGFCLLVTLPGVVGATVAIALMGVQSGAGRPFGATIRQERTPIELRGRVFGANLALIELATPLGMLIAGWLLATTSLRVTLALAVAIGIAQLVAALILPAFREINLRQSPLTTPDD